MRISFVFLLYLTGSLSNSLLAQQPSPEQIRQYHQLLQGQDEVLLTNSDNAFDLYLTGYQIFLNTALHAGDSAFEVYFARIEELTSSIQPSDPWANYVLAEFKLQEAFIELKAGNELAAAWKLRQAFRMTEKALSSAPLNPALYKTMGVMKCLIGSIPDKMQWVPSLFGISGSLNEGISDLTKACQESPWICQETHLLLALSYSYLLSEDQLAVNQAEKSLNMSGIHPLPAYLIMNIYLRAHQSANALGLYKRLSTEQRNQLPMIDYLAGNASLQKGEYAHARESYRFFLKNHPSEDFIKDAWYKTGLAWWLDGDKEKAKKAFEESIRNGQSQTEADRYAEKHAKLPLPDPSIMKIRLFTDGGFYTQAKKVLTSTSSGDYPELEEKTELIYRGARLKHLTGDTLQAIADYEKVIKLQGDGNYYFAPNSCLQLGYLLAESDRQKARLWFEKVKDYRDYEYEKGIERKAQAALTHYK